MDIGEFLRGLSLEQLVSISKRAEDELWRREEELLEKENAATIASHQFRLRLDQARKESR